MVVVTRLPPGCAIACLDLLGSAVAPVRVRRSRELCGHVGIDLTALRLLVRPVRTTDVRTFIPRQAEPIECINDAEIRRLGAALDIGIFNAEHEGATLVPCECPVE